MAAASGEARGKSFGRNRPVDVIDTYNGNRQVKVSAGDAEDNPDRYIPANGETARALMQASQIADVRQGIDNVRKAAGVLDQGFANKALIAGALGKPESTVGAFLLGQVASGNLTEAQADYVTALRSLMERAMAIRGMQGSAQGEDVRNAILAAIPGSGTPSKDFVEKQLNQLGKMVDQIERGVESVPLRNAAGSQDGGAAPAAGGYAQWKASQGK